MTEQARRLRAMKRAAAASAAAELDPERCRLRLFVTGTTPRSARAVQNLRAICEEHLEGRYDLEVIDIYQHPEFVKAEQIVVTPTLVKHSPLPVRKLIGDLSDTARVLAALEIVLRQVPVELSLSTKLPGKNMRFDTPTSDAQLAETRELQNRVRDLQGRLDEAEETLRALSSGEVDAIVAGGPEGDRIYTLKGADETYRVMVQEMAEGALTLTLDGLILFSNKQFASMLRRPLEHVIGSRFLDFVAPDDIPGVSELLRRTGSRKAEARLSVDGAAFVPVYLSVQNVILDGVECYCLIVTDLSAQKRYEEIVAVMEAVPVGVFIAHDRECRKMVGNRMAYELLRLPAGANVSKSAPEGEIPRSWREMKDGRDIPPADLPMQRAARSGQPVRDYEFEMLFDDGTARCWLANAVPLFDEARQSRGAVGTFVDITDRKRAAEALESTNAELRNFADVLVQGLQEPLNVVSDSLRLAQERHAKLGADPGEYLSRSAAGASQMENILKKLLRYWEVTERSGENLSPVDCNRLLSQALVHLQSEIAHSRAIVTSDPLPTLVADEVMLAQVFENLIGNSIQHRGEAAPEIHVSAERVGERWLFSVRDNGIGVDRADSARVFEMFRRSCGQGVPGAGFGLALCRKVIERHGGRIWVESELGQGVAFRFTIPTYLATTLPGFSTLESRSPDA